jgi:hypothetical protein
VNEKLEWHVTTSLEIEDIRAALATALPKSRLSCQETRTLT